MKKPSDMSDDELLEAMQKEVAKLVVSYVLIDLFKELDKRYRRTLEEIETIKNKE